MDKKDALIKANHFAEVAEKTAKQPEAQVALLQTQIQLSMMYSQLYLAISKSEESK